MAFLVDGWAEIETDGRLVIRVREVSSGGELCLGGFGASFGIFGGGGSEIVAAGGGRDMVGRGATSFSSHSSSFSDLEV